MTGLGCNHGENGVFVEEIEKSDSRADFDEGRWRIDMCLRYKQSVCSG